MNRLLSTAIASISLLIPGPANAQEMLHNLAIPNGQQALELLSEDGTKVTRYFAAKYLVNSCQTDSECFQAFELYKTTIQSLWGGASAQIIDEYATESIERHEQRTVNGYVDKHGLCLYNTDSGVFKYLVQKNQEPYLALILPNNQYFHNFGLNPFSDDGFVGDCF